MTKKLSPITIRDNKKITTLDRELVPGTDEYIRTVGTLERIILAEDNTCGEDFLYDFLSACTTPEKELDFS